MKDKSNFGYEMMRDGKEEVMREYKMLNVALCGTSPKILINSPYVGTPPTTSSVFPEVVESPMDFAGHSRDAYEWMRNHMDFIKEKHDREVPNRVNLFVEGPTPCLIAFLHNWGHSWPCELYLMHWDINRQKYVEDFWSGCL